MTQKHRLRKYLNLGARTVACLGYRDHVSDTLSELGWRAVGEMVTERDLCTMLHNRCWRENRLLPPGAAGRRRRWPRCSHRGPIPSLRATFQGINMKLSGVDRVTSTYKTNISEF